MPIVVRQAHAAIRGWGLSGMDGTDKNFLFRMFSSYTNIATDRVATTRHIMLFVKRKYIYNNAAASPGCADDKSHRHALIGPYLRGEIALAELLQQEINEHARLRGQQFLAGIVHGQGAGISMPAGQQAD